MKNKILENLKNFSGVSCEDAVKNIGAFHEAFSAKSEKRHPEDIIYQKKEFINELAAVQEDYFGRLVDELQINTKGGDFLFDYIYNSRLDEHDGFDDYLSHYGHNIEDFIKWSLN